MSAAKKVLKRNSKLAWRTVEDETVIMPLSKQLEDGEVVNTLNSTATRIWGLIDGKRSEEDLVKKIVQEYNIEPALAAVKIKKFLNILAKKQLIV